VKENTEAGNIKLSEDDLKGINETLAKFEVKGGRYPAMMDGMQVSRGMNLMQRGGVADLDV
jgi:hypothetical protein